LDVDNVLYRNEVKIEIWYVNNISQEEFFRKMYSARMIDNNM